VFILAHSMSTTFALWYAHLFNSVDGLILMAPYIRTLREVGRDVVMFSLVTLVHRLDCVFLPAVFFKLVKIGKRRQAFVANEVAVLRIGNN
jgi:pimeloyl-ACP methyl ester carboxylesterase